MPRYNVKYRETMSREQFMKAYVRIPNPTRRAFCLLLYLTGCRVSEILAVTYRDLTFIHDQDKFMLTVHRLKGSKQSNNILPIPLTPLTSVFHKLMFGGTATTRDQRIFPFGRRTALRYVRRYFDRYPHFFRMNRLTKMVEANGGPVTKTWFGIGYEIFNYYIAEKNLEIAGANLE